MTIHQAINLWCHVQSFDKRIVRIDFNCDWLQVFKNRLLNVSVKWTARESVRICVRWIGDRTPSRERATTSRVLPGGTRAIFQRAAARVAEAFKLAKSTAFTKWPEVVATRCPSVPIFVRNHLRAPSSTATWSIVQSNGRRANGVR